MAATANTNPIPATTAPTAVVTASPPWNQVVRGSESDPIVAPPSPTAENPPKAAWNKKITPKSTPSQGNGGVAAESGGSPAAFTTEQWPSLSEGTTKSSPKLSPLDSSNILPDFGSNQVTGIDVSSTTTVLSARSPSSTGQKPTANHSNHHGQPARQKSMKRDGEGNSQPNGVSSHQSSHPAVDIPQYHHNNPSPKSSSGGSSENSAKDNVRTPSPRESGQRNATGDYPHHRSSYRRGNGGAQSRGDGSHQTYGGRRRDQERGNHDWNHQKSFNGRDAYLQPSVVSRGLVRPPPVATPFIHHPHVQPPFMNPGMPDLPIFYLPPAGMQFVAPVPQMYFSAPDPELYSEIMKQINYYFSNENLVRDTFLRERMDENGWVSVDVISNFNRVKNLTMDTFQILEAVRPSSVVEVQGDKIRRRDDWMRWIMPPAVQFSTSGSQSPRSPAVSAVTDAIQSVSLDGKTDEPSTVKGAVAGTAHALQASSAGSNSAPQTTVDEASPGGY